MKSTVMSSPLTMIFTRIGMQLADDLAASRFVTTFLGRLDPAANRIDYHSGGQGPLLHFHAATGQCEWHNASSAPLGILSQPHIERPAAIHLAPGDSLVVLTDGFFEFHNHHGKMMGIEIIEETCRANAKASASELLKAFIALVEKFANGAEQADDLTGIVVRRAS